jgi:hypothetical protein
VIESLNLPKADLKLKRRNNEIYVWCIIRKKELICTPEEWVRQHVIHYLINEKNIAPGLITSEFAISYNGLSKRADIVVFNKEMRPLLIVECKASSVAISKQTLFQIAQYNHELDVDYLFLTNGLEHVTCRVNKKTKSIDYIEELPVGLI